MHRKALISYGARFNSTVANAPHWSDVRSPTRKVALKIPKTLKQKKDLYSPDLSYLEKASETSLAGRLAQPIIRTENSSAPRDQEREPTKLYTPGSTIETKKIELSDIVANTQQKIEASLFGDKKGHEPKDVAAITQTRPEARLSEMAVKKSHEPIDVAAITQKRIEARLSREMAAKNRNPYFSQQRNLKGHEPIDVAAITQKRIEARLSREMAAKNNIAVITHKRIEARLSSEIRAVQDNADKLNSLGPILNPPGSRPLSPSELKRRQARHLRESTSIQNRHFPSLNKEGSSQSGNKKFETATPSIDSAELEVTSSSLDKEGSSQSGNKILETATPSTDSAELDLIDLEEDEASPTIQAPECTGPEPISESFDFGLVQIHPSANGHDSVEVSESPSYRLNSNLIDSLVGGDYSEYTSLSSSISNSTSPTALTVLNTAELALSRQRDYIIPQRNQAIETVKALVEGKFVQATKESNK